MSAREDILSGDRLALSRFLTQVENSDPGAGRVLDDLYIHAGKAHRIGVTGAPGTGKSSLVNRLAQHIRQTLKKTVAIIAVDPSSPFTGGAILGDRLRMRDLAGDPGVFIRSMASRGTLGGLALTTRQLTRVFDAAGFDYIIIETVGAGQSEVEIARLAHTTIVVEAPGFGDDIQAIKAGIMEIADILVINKADQAGADNTERALRANLELGYRQIHNRKTGHDGEIEATEEATTGWIPPILKTVATNNEGIGDLLDAIGRHNEFLAASGQMQTIEKEGLEQELLSLLQNKLMNNWRNKAGTLKMETALDEVFNHRWSPDQAADWLIEQSF
jgi:LAO/AO transport system kinase